MGNSRDMMLRPDREVVEELSSLRELMSEAEDLALIPSHWRDLPLTLM